MNALKAKPWAVLAVISLAVNLFLGGLVAGKFLRPGPPPPGDFGRIALFRGSRDMDPQTRKIVDQVRDRHRDGIRSSIWASRKAREAAIDALCADDFDEAGARRAFGEFRERSERARSEMHEALIEVAGAMTPDQRVSLREALTRRDKHGRRRGRPPGSGHPFHHPFHHRGRPGWGPRPFPSAAPTVSAAVSSTAPAVSGSSPPASSTPPAP